MEKDTGRMTGKTTRTVDHAIQTLFEIGEIYVPIKNSIEREIKEGFRERNLKTVVLDPDWGVSSMVQNRLIDLILNRLRNEHPRIPIKRNNRTLFIADEKYVRNGI